MYKICHMPSELNHKVHLISLSCASPDFAPGPPPDCCDGSDEYATDSCPNTCDAIGAAARARQKQVDEMRMRGYEIKLKLIEEGKEKLAEKQVTDPGFW